MEITIENILEVVEASRGFNDFRQMIMHLQNKLTDTDIAQDARKQSRKLTKKEQFDIAAHKKKYDGMGYDDFLEYTEGK